MPCYSPLTGWRSRQLSKNGKRPIVFKRENGFTDMEVQVPCGQCIGCRLAKSRKWAIRCLNEAQLHEDNCFITLTYNDENLPHDFSLNDRHLELFWKRLRKYISPVKVRYYACGEYGDISGRPHYHAILFGFNFDDKVLISTKDDTRLYTSETLEKLWGFGFVTIGEVTFESAAYVARYVVKKQTGSDSPDHYTFVDESTGEIYQVMPEFARMSRRPGIGAGFVERFKSEIVRDDFLISNGRKVEVPTYYDKLIERESEEEYQRLKGKRRRKIKENPEWSDPDRIATKELVKKAQLKFLKRTL